MIAKKPIYIKWVVKTHDSTQDTCMDNIKNKFFYKTRVHKVYRKIDGEMVFYSKREI